MNEETWFTVEKLRNIMGRLRITINILIMILLKHNSDICKKF